MKNVPFAVLEGYRHKARQSAKIGSTGGGAERSVSNGRGRHRTVPTWVAQAEGRSTGEGALRQEKATATTRVNSHWECQGR